MALKILTVNVPGEYELKYKDIKIKADI